MSYIEPKVDFKDGDVLHGVDLNASNAVVKAGVDDNFDRIQGLETSKQDVLTAGEGIQIEDNVISNTNISAVWGNIDGTLENQTDLQAALDTKVDKIEGKGLSTNDYDNTSKEIVDNVTTNLAGKVDKIEGKGLSTEDYSTAEKTKLAGIAEGAEVNVNSDWSAVSGDAAILNKPTTISGFGITDAYTKTEMDLALGNKVDKVSGKGLSTNDYTTEEKNKLSGIEAGAEENIIETIKVNGTALTPDANKAVDITVAGDADNISYDNTSSGLTADDVQEAIDEIVSDFSGKVNEPLNEGTDGQVLTTDGNGGRTWTTVQGGGGGGTSNYNDLNNKPQINSVTLSGNKSLSDLGINIPTKLSDLTNDNNTVTDADYVHTDNNYTSAEKTKLGDIETGAEVNDIDTIKVNGTAQTISNKEVNITVPTKLSDLTNDNNTVTDASYVHTDNNYTSSEKTKLSGIEAGAQVNVSEITVEPDTATQDTVLLIEDEDLDFQGLEISNTYTTGNNVAYSADYANKAFGGKILWTNPNPTAASFNEQNITLSSADYDMYEVLYLVFGGASTTMDSAKSIKGYGMNLVMAGYLDKRRAGSRTIAYVNDTTLSVGRCYTFSSNDDATDDTRCVPLYVIGYKTGLFS